MILVIDTAGKTATIALALDKKIEQLSWEAGRELSANILYKIEELYKKFNIEFKQTKAVIVNAGPGSFTGLRIGISIANAFAYGLNIPIIGVANEENFERIIQVGKSKLKGKKNFEKSVEPVYGAEPNITTPKKN